VMLGHGSLVMLRGFGFVMLGRRSVFLAGLVRLGARDTEPHHQRATEHDSEQRP